MAIAARCPNGCSLGELETAPTCSSAYSAIIRNRGTRDASKSNVRSPPTRWIGPVSPMMQREDSPPRSARFAMSHASRVAPLGSSQSVAGSGTSAERSPCCRARR